MRYLVLISVFAVFGCTQAVYMRHPASGQVVQCGPYQLEGFAQPASVAQREAQCIRDWKEQGYVRAAN